MHRQVADKYNVLIFCCTKISAEVVAEQLAKRKNYGKLESQPIREQLIAKMTNATNGAPSPLRRLILRGVAWHHAGLTSEERQIIEEGFRMKTIKILVATTTLVCSPVLILP